MEFLEVFAMGNLDFLPNPLFFITPEEELPSPERFFENDFTGNFMATSNGMVALWVMALLAYFPCKLIIRCSKNTKSLPRRLAEKVIKMMEWSGFIMLWIGTYMEM